MPLNFTDDLIDWTSGISIRATNTTGKSVVVMVSHEAMNDYGRSHAQEVASDKYDKGQIEPNGTIAVRTADFMTTTIVGL